MTSLYFDPVVLVSLLCVSACSLRPKCLDVKCVALVFLFFVLLTYLLVFHVAKCFLDVDVFYSVFFVL